MSLWANAPAAPALPTEAEAVVVGGGPAGWTAALYLARAMVHPVVLAGSAVGGQLMDTGVVENFPGFPDGIDGPELMARMREQAEKAGARVHTLDAVEVQYGAGAGAAHDVVTSAGTVRTRAVVLATGSTPRRLGIDGEAELLGKGLAYCAVCEAPLFKGRDVAVVGGGDSAMEEALALSKHARQVTLLHRSDSFRATPVLLDRVRQLRNVRIRTGVTVQAVHTGPSGELDRITVHDARAGDEQLAVQGLFVAIGHTPRTELLPTTATPGVFTAGDVADDRYRQAVTAAGAGCAAALDTVRYLEATHG